MCAFFLGANRRWVLAFVLLLAGACLSFAETTLQEVDAGPVNQADLELEFFPDPPSVLPCGRTFYSTRATNHGPSDDERARIHLAALVKAVGCLDDPRDNGICTLGHIPAGESRIVTFTGELQSDTPEEVFFGAVLRGGSTTDPSGSNNVISVYLDVTPDSPPTLDITQPNDGAVIDFDMTSNINLVAETTDVEDDDTTLGQGVVWRSDRVVEELGIGSSLNVPTENLGVGGHKITATVTDSCNNSTSDFINIGVAPANPIAAENAMTLEKEGEQGQPDVASTGPSSFVVVWANLDDSDSDTDGGIRAQRFRSDGSLMGDEIQVNESTVGLQHRPAVASRGDGSFVVVWQGSPDTNPDSPLANIFLRQFDSLGQPSAERQANISTDGGKLHPDVASRRDGSFLVAWESPSQGDPDGGVVARYFDSAGSGLNEFQVNSYFTGKQGRPTLIAAPDAGFLAAWQSQGSFGNDHDGYSIQLRRLDETTGTGEEIQVNQESEGDQTDPSIDGNLMGRVVVVWRNKTATSDAQKRTLRISGGSTTADGFTEVSPANFEVFGPIFVSKNNPRQLSPPVTAHSPDGDFVVVWADGPAPDETFSVQARPFFGLNSSPKPIGDPFLLDEAGLGLPTIAYSHSSSQSTDFFAFWETANMDGGSSLEDPKDALNIRGAEVTLPFPPLQADLSLVVRDTPDPVLEGSPLGFNIRVENLGPADSSAVEVMADLPAEWTFLSSPDCNSASTDVICQLGTILVGEVRDLEVNGFVQLGAPTFIKHRVEVLSATPNTTGAPVIVVGATEILPSPTELLLTVTDAPDPVTEGRPLTFNIQVENLGPADAKDVEVMANLSADWTFLSSPDCNSPSPDVVCQLGTILVGQTRDIQVDGFVHLGAPASIEHRVEVLSASPSTTGEPVFLEGTTTVLSAPRVDPLFSDSFESGDTHAWSDSQSFVNASQHGDRP